MVELFDRFPEVLLIDATHGTNACKYKVFSFMAHDIFGKGQYVQHAIMQNERSETLFSAIEEFKKNNSSWSKLQCVIIDKDFTEIGVLKSTFPNVRVLLCQFHVVKYLREEIACADYAFTSWQKSQLRTVMSLLVYARSERKFEKHCRYMTHLTSVGSGSFVGTGRHADSESGTESGGVGVEGESGIESGTVGSESCSRLGVPSHPFECYFTKNWDSCRDMWCSYARQNAVTLGNNTNNRLESSWKQMKEVVNSSMGLDECLALIMFYQTRAEQQFYDQATKVSVDEL
ncbi:unnamed protein product [Phytophthora fragariaefolia]|uniref:Unnamed protein product n=1 Tax=Phytophthora fragariaefolia TaxID=1490495 RepID=A0A9W7CZV4_9STRA|nr:unnamed protein product [Phytophthora fragariaefolia]